MWGGEGKSGSRFLLAEPVLEKGDDVRGLRQPANVAILFYPQHGHGSSARRVRQVVQMAIVSKDVPQLEVEPQPLRGPTHPMAEGAGFKVIKGQARGSVHIS